MSKKGTKCSFRFSQSKFKVGRALRKDIVIFFFFLTARNVLLVWGERTTTSQSLFKKMKHNNTLKL